MEKNLKSKLLPFILSILVIIADQVTKALVVKYIPIMTIGASFFGDFFRIIHVANTGVAFSFGASWSETLRHIMFLLVPVVVIILVIVVYFRNNDFTAVQRWAVAGIIGGGIGNLIDRFFRSEGRRRSRCSNACRSEGVVDFLDVKWFGITDSKLSLLRMTRWPTFNVADSAVVVCGIMLIISFIITFSKSDKDKENNQK